jgi:plastocyanin
MRRTLAVLATFALALVVTACGDDGGDSADPACQPVTSSFEVGAQDKLRFDADSYEADAGCIEVTYLNEGNVPHTLLVKDHKGFKLSVGRSDTGTIELPAGTYELYCDIAGHESAGMKAELTVS